MFRRFVPLLLLSSLLLVACGGTAATPPEATLVQVTPLPADTAAPPTAEPPTPEPAPTSTPAVSLTEQMDAFVQAEADAGRFSGAMLVMHDGEILLSKGYGLADRAAGIPNTTATRFPLNWLTRPFTAVALLQLQDQGKLDIHDPVCDYLVNCPAGWAGVQIHHLLTQSSGISSDDLLAVYNVATTEDEPAAALVERLAESKPEFDPGSQWAGPFNSEYLLLGLIIEKASGQTYADFLQDNIFSPLGTTRTGLTADTTDLALGYDNQEDTTPRAGDIVGGFASSGLTTTLDDMALWVQALLSEELLTAESTDKMQERHVDMGDGFYTGYGWFISDFDERYLNVSMPGPGAPGYSPDMAYFPDEGVAWVILANQDDVETSHIGDTLSRMVLAAEE